MKVLIAVVFTIIVGLIYNVVKKDKVYLKGLLKYLGISLAIATLLEVFVFNFRHFESLFYGQETNAEYKLGEGFECNNGCVITNMKDAYIEINNIDRKIKNVYIDLSKDDEDLIVEIDYYLRDEGNEVYYKAGSRTFTEILEISKYAKINPSGKVKSIKLDFWQINGTFKINEIKLNTRVPLIFNTTRFIISLLIILMISVIRPKSIFHNLSFDKLPSKIVICILAMILIISSVLLSNNNQYIKDLHQNQYNFLAEALIDGHFNLNITPTDELLAMENPYDFNNRNALDVNYYWDYAFYKGKYYTYFGIVPCLLFYVPFHLVFDRYLPDYIVLGVTSTIFVMSVFIFLYQLCKRYFKNTSLPWFLLIGTFMIFGSSFMMALGEPTYYNTPILLANVFAYLGLACWLASKNFDKKYRKLLLGLGSLCIALIAGCRPQLLVAALLGIPILWDDVFKNRELFSKKSIKESTMFILPFVIIALLIMYYNFARFGSPFDFGANYNLTFNDMTHRGFHIDRIPLGLFTYLFETPRITSIFPYVLKYSVNTTYIGITISEQMRGGFMIINLICLISLMPWKFKKVIENKKLYYLTLLSSIFALIIIIVDSQMAGILTRYYMDFAWLFTLSTVIILLSLLRKYKNEDLKKIIIILLFVSIIYNALIYVTQSSLYIDQDLFYEKLYHLFVFWL